MDVLARTKLLTKLLSINLIVAVIVGGCIWFAQNRMMAVDAAYSTMIVRDAKAVSNVRRSNRLHMTLAYLLYRLIAETDPQRIRSIVGRFDTVVGETGETLAELARQVPAFSDLVLAQRDRTDLFVAQALAVRGLALAGQRAAALDRAREEIDPSITTLGIEGKRLGDAIEGSMYARSDALTVQTGAARYGLIGFGTLGLLAGVVCASLVSVLGISRPVGRLVAALERMARGEVMAEIAEGRRRDEIGAVGRAVDGIKAMMVRKAAEEAERLRRADAAAAQERRHATVALAARFEEAVGGIAAQVSASAAELQATAARMTSAAAEAANQSGAVATAAEEAASNVGTVAAAAEELGTSITEIGRQVENASDLARRAVGEADQTVHRMQALSGVVAKIDTVVGLIADISGQTNLLALNAAIEAARAGEAGRGFAVVAAEVKALASQTASATDEVAAQIGAVQGTTHAAVAAIGAITGRIREIDDLAAGIAAAVEEQGAATQEIVRNVAEAASGTGAVTGNIAGVAKAAEGTGMAAAQVLESASDLSRQSDRLTDEVRRFLETVRAA